MARPQDQSLMLVVKRVTMFSAIVSLTWFVSITEIRAEDKNANKRKATGNRLEFSGDHDHVLIPGLRYDGKHPLTLEAVVIPYKRDPEPTRACIVGNLQLSGIGLHYSHKHWLFHVNDGRDGNGGYASVGAEKLAQLNKPVHVAGVYDGKLVQIYINGKLQPRASQTNNPHFPSKHDFMVGADPDDEGFAHQFFKGIIDEVRISKVARYTKDFTPAKQKFKTDKNTLVLYHFDEGRGKIAKDASGNGNHGKIYGAKWVKEESNHGGK